MPSAPTKPSTWWHSNKNDPKDHVTVRYNRRKGGDRVHVYRDGTGNMNPHKPPKRLTRRSEAAQDEELYGSDCTVEFSDEEDGDQ